MLRLWLDLTYEAGKTVTYTYDNRNRLTGTGIVDWTGRTTALAYDGAGRLLTLTRPNGTVRANTWDAASQLTAVMDKHTASGKPVLALKLGYDAAGRLTDKFEVPAWAALPPLPVRNATHNLDNQLTDLNGQTILSDTDGNISSAPALAGVSPLESYAWNPRNQLTGAPGGLTFSYDAEGLRTSTTQGGQTTTFVNDPHGPMSRLLWRIRPDGTRTFYIYGPVLLYEIEESASGGNPDNAARFFHYDHRGSTISLSNDAGQPVARANYSAYGILISSTGTLNTPFQWQGAFGVQTDPNGLHHMRARYYHAYLGRFMSEDPIGFAGGMNWYAYADGNPINKVDPSGNVSVAGGFYFELDVILQFHVDVQLSASASGLNPIDWRFGAFGNLVPFTGSVTNLGLSGGLIGTISPSSASVSQLSGWTMGVGGAVSPLGNGVPIEINASVWNMPDGPPAYSVGAGLSGSFLPVSVSVAAGHTWASDTSPREAISLARKYWSGPSTGAAPRVGPATSTPASTQNHPSSSSRK